MIQTIPDPKKDHKEFKSESGVKVNFATKGSVNSVGATLAKAALEIEFSNKDSIFFNAAECSTTRIANKAKIGEILKQLLKTEKWKKKYCVVTDLVQAGKTVIAISDSNNSKLSFEADSPAIERINLADARIKFNLTSEDSIGYKVDAAEGLIILIGLCKIKNPFLWWGGDFGPKISLVSDSMEYAIENEPGIKTESNIDDLYLDKWVRIDKL